MDYNSSKCESLFEYLLPHLYSNLRESGYANLYNLYIDLSSNKLSSGSVGKEQLLLGYTHDLSVYYAKCNQLESDLMYILWLIDLIKPFVLTVVFVSFVIPIMFCGLFLSTSMFLFISKHWSKLKV